SDSSTSLGTPGSIAVTGAPCFGAANSNQQAPPMFRASSRTNSARTNMDRFQGNPGPILARIRLGPPCEAAQHEVVHAGGRGEQRQQFLRAAAGHEQRGR